MLLALPRQFRRRLRHNVQRKGLKILTPAATPRHKYSHSPPGHSSALSPRSPTQILSSASPYTCSSTLTLISTLTSTLKLSTYTFNSSPVQTPDITFTSVTAHDMPNPDLHIEPALLAIDQAKAKLNIQPLTNPFLFSASMSGSGISKTKLP
jgi:hypothetical protein